MLAPVLITPPAVAPVGLADFAGAKLHARVEHDEEDGLIEAYIQAATQYLDGWNGVLGRALITQTWRQDFRHFGWTNFVGTDWRPYLRLPLAPVQSIDEITYWDGDGGQQTLAPATYALRADALGPFVELAPDQSWPSVYSRSDAVSVTFTAGYGDDPEDVPQPIRQAIRMAVTHFYENRAGQAWDMGGFKALISPYKRNIA